VAYPDDLLVDGEQIVMHKHPHWKMLVWPVLAFLIVVAAASFLAALVSAQTWALWAWIAIAVVAVALIGWRTTHFVVTTRRVLVREGLVARHGLDIPMSRINSVQFRHTVVERLLGCGTLIIESASDEPLEFTDIPRVERVHALLYQEVADEND
jgi:uncharacterized membrane protein YdbT with pleckstrin-like domain